MISIIPFVMGVVMLCGVFLPGKETFGQRIVLFFLGVIITGGALATWRSTVSWSKPNIYEGNEIIKFEPLPIVHRFNFWIALGLSCLGFSLLFFTGTFSKLGEGKYIFSLIVSLPTIVAAFEYISYRHAYPEVVSTIETLTIQGVKLENADIKSIKARMVSINAGRLAQSPTYLIEINLYDPKKYKNEFKNLRSRLWSFAHIVLESGHYQQGSDFMRDVLLSRYAQKRISDYRT